MSKHTPGPWRIDGEEDRIVIWVPAVIGQFHIADRIGGQVHAGEDGDFSDYSEVEANARLIAAAPDGLAAAKAAYLLILQIPPGTLRALNQSAYCMLRDFIAEAEGRDYEEVQCEYERAALAATGAA